MPIRESDVGLRCYQCKDRHPACHDTCEIYLERKAKDAEHKKQITEGRRKAGSLYDHYHYRSIVKSKREKRKKESR
jgi:hypothetical protein